jgi:hypothetical protein
MSDRETGALRLVMQGLAIRKSQDGRLSRKAASRIRCRNCLRKLVSEPRLTPSSCAGTVTKRPVNSIKGLQAQSDNHPTDRLGKDSFEVGGGALPLHPLETFRATFQIGAYFPENLLALAAQVGYAFSLPSCGIAFVMCSSPRSRKDPYSLRFSCSSDHRGCLATPSAHDCPAPF